MRNHKKERIGSTIKLPSTIKVAARTYVIKQDYHFVEKDTLEGQIDYRLQEIRLRKIDWCGGELHHDHQWQIFFHEILHAIDNAYNSTKLDDDTVDRLASGLYQVLKENKITIEEAL